MGSPTSAAPRIVRRVPGDGVELACAKWLGEGEPIVAIHGLTASYMSFVGVGERLAGRRPLVAVDLRGRGDSDKPTGPYSIEQHARDVAVAMRALGIGPSVIVGHSMGAYVAEVLAAQMPELVAGVVLLDGGYMAMPPPGTPVEPILEAVLASLVSRLTVTFKSYREYREHWKQRDLFIDSDFSRWIDAYLDYDLEGAPPMLIPKPYAPGVRQDFFDMGRTDLVEARLKAVRAPVLVIRAEFGFNRAQPGIVPLSSVERIRACVPNVEVESIPGTTHYTIALADPGATRVADLLVQFAERCGR